MNLLINEADGNASAVVDEKLIKTMKRAAEIASLGEDVDPETIEISLSFVTAEEIRELNREYRDVDRVTDVLSFPLIEDLDALPDREEEDDPEEGADRGAPEPIALGDVVICLEKAEEQAREYGHSREREIVYLFVHSVLHLLGYDHMEEEEKKRMRLREETIMQAIHLSREDR